MYRYEFAPFDLGSSLNLERNREKIREEATRLGWEDASRRFAESDVSNIIPNNVVLLEADNLLVYIPESGFGVVRYQFQHSNQQEQDPEVHVTAEALLARHSFQKNIDDTSSRLQVEVEALVLGMRRYLERGNNPEKRLLIPHPNLHKYSLSVFAVSSQFPDRLGLCLLHPRQLGCSVGNDNPPSPLELVEAIKAEHDFELSEEYAALDQQLEGVRSSWSAVLVNEDPSDLNLNLVTLCEFHVQSTWYAANCASEMAARATEVPNLNKRRWMLLVAQSGLERMRWLTERRLGANDPDVPKRILSQIVTTSEVQREVENAVVALQQALGHVEIEIERRSSYGRKLVQVFSLVLASAGLAQVMLPLPITAQVISEHLWGSLVWFVVTLVGAILVFWQER